MASLSWLPNILSLLALFISLGTLWYVRKTYAAHYRPYVGIVKFEHGFEGNPPNSMRWKLGLKNVGSIPAWVEFEETSVSLTTQDQTTITPVATTFGNKAYLVPEQICYISGNIEGAGSARAIFDGTTILEVNVKLNYNQPGRLKKKYRYASSYRFLSLGQLSDFLLVSGDAN